MEAADHFVATIVQHERRIKCGLYERIEALVSHLVDVANGDESDPRGLFIWGSHDRSAPLEGHRLHLEKCTKCSISEILQDLRWNRVWPVALAFRKSMLGWRLDDLDRYDSSGVLCESCNLHLSKIMKAYAQMARLFCRGLCLDCVKSGRKGSEKPYACRFKHRTFAIYLGLDDVSYG